MRWVAAALLVATLAAPRTASAYCLASTCRDQDVCDGADGGGCLPLRWPNGCMGFSVQSDGSFQVPAGSTELIAELAFDAWRGVDCGGGPAGIYVWNLGQVSCGRVEYNKDAGNANVILFRDDEWPHAETEHNIALTTTTFDPDTGDLLDADIELNSAMFRFTVDDTSTDYDLLSVLTHEAGHFLGLGHTVEADATMFPSYESGTFEIRTLEADDVAGLCALYPPDPGANDTCNPLQRHGFSPTCRDDQSEGSCSAARATGDSPRGRWAGAALGALALGAIRARTARRRPSRRRSA